MKKELNELTVNGSVYVLKGTEKAREFDGDIKIVVLQRGWVYIGRFEKIGNDCKLHNAYNIRIWGTSKGLPELVNGATSQTKLDKCDGIVEFDWLTVVHTITVNKESWKQI
jgi:hypothetical protein